MTSLFASSINGAARGVQVGDNIRQRRRAASASEAADAWQQNAADWKKQATHWHKRLCETHEKYVQSLKDFDDFIANEYNPLVDNLHAWQKHAADMKGYMKKGYTMWVGGEYDRDNAYLAIQKMSELIRRLDPDNQEFDNPNKLGMEIQDQSIERLKSAITRYLEESKVGTPFSAQFTEETLDEEIVKRLDRAKEHKEAVNTGDHKMKMF